MSARLMDFILFSGLYSFTGIIYFDSQIIPDFANPNPFKCVYAHIIIQFHVFTYVISMSTSISSIPIYYEL